MYWYMKKTSYASSVALLAACSFLVCDLAVAQNAQSSMAATVSSQPAAMPDTINSIYAAAYNDFDLGNFQAAIRKWDMLAKSKHPESAYALGVMYDNGYGLPQDSAMAMRWYKYAANLGSVDAAEQVAMRIGNAGKSATVEEDRTLAFSSDFDLTDNPSVFVDTSQLEEESDESMVAENSINQQQASNTEGAAATLPSSNENTADKGDRQIYITGNLGLLTAFDNDGTNSGSNVDLSYDPGYFLSGAIGYKLDNLRLELEVGYNSADIDSVSLAGVSASQGGELSSLTVFTNAYYDIAGGALFGKTITPYVGGGLGLAYVDKKIDAISFDENNVAFAWNLEGGFAYTLLENGLEVVPSYRLIGYANEENDIDSDYVNVFKIGLRYPL